MARRTSHCVSFRGYAMKPENIDWSVLRGALVIFVVVMTVSTVIGYAGYYFRTSMQNEYQKAQSAFNSISSRYLQVDEQEATIKAYYPRFVNLYEQGVIGTERRLNWLESLQRVTDSLEIPGLRYEIASQQQSKARWPIDTGRFQLYSSNMKLNLEMLHEADLLRLVERLGQTGAGFFSLTDCSMSRRVTEIHVESLAPNVTANCNLDWYSIKLSSGEEIKI